MKKIISVLLLAATCHGVNAQEPVLSFDGELYFIPGSMTKGGEAFMVSVNMSDNKGFTIYDGDFNVVGEFADPTVGQHYQQRRVILSRVVDPGTSSDSRTRAATDDWTVENDQTFDCTTSSTLAGFEMYSDNNNYHSRYLYVTQTLFDDDEDFEYVRTRQTIVPISINYSDYVKEHSTGTSNEPIYSISHGDATLDSIMQANGAYEYQYFWDSERGKQMLRLYKYETYGGIYTEGIEIVTLDGTVKAFLPGITYLSSAYYFRGKCYVQGYGNDNSSVLYLLGNGTTGIKEVRRAKADIFVSRVGNDLVFDSDSDGKQTLVMSTMDGRVVRSLPAKQGSNHLSLSELHGGVYIVTLYQQSRPMKSAKIIVR